MIQLFSNNFITTAAVTIGVGDTTITLADGSGMNAPVSGEYEQLTLYNGAAYEIISVTARTGNVVTVTRAQEGTAAIACVIGDYVFGGISAGTISRLRTESLGVAVSKEGTSLAVGADLTTFRVTYPFTLSEVRASVSVAPTGTGIVVDLKVLGVSILSTLLTIDVGEKTSFTAAIPAVISTIDLADDTEVSVSVTQVGSANPGEGLKVYLKGQQA